jgi:predicted membrane-bound mannosyltransferase
VVPACLGILTVLTPLLFVRALGRTPALVACAFLAVSPAMVYYSRYYIPEMLLVFLTACLMAVVRHYSDQPSLVWALVAGGILGLMFATKETAVIAAGAMTPAVFSGLRTKRAAWWHLLAALAVAVLPAVALLGARDVASSMGAYAGRAIQGGAHVHPWYYYFHLLLGWRASGGPFWSEALIIGLGSVGAILVLAETEPRPEGAVAPILDGT